MAVPRARHCPAGRPRHGRGRRERGAFPGLGPKLTARQEGDLQ
jgi:hypothetical protein